MGDTGGSDADKANFEKILSYLHHYKSLSGIIILLKANETRKTASFRYCINQLLAHLHKSACKNIIFCFTFSRNSHYGPGEGFTTLRGFLDKELAGVDLTLKCGVNCYFVDNEAFRFLIAKKHGYPFHENQEMSYRESWDISAEQTHKMMQNILNLEPHSLVETCSLFNARKLILALAEPMVKIQLNINANMGHLKKEWKRIMGSKQSRDEMAKNLNVELEYVIMRPLEKPTTVCAANKCIEVIEFQGQNKIHYKTRCHVDCEMMETNSIGDESLKQCLAFGRSNNCTHCGCHWKEHKHLTYEYVVVKRTMLDVNKQKELDSVDSSIRQSKQVCRALKETLIEYQEEYKVVSDVCAKFAYILETNSTTAYNRFIEPYLELLIDEEKQKVVFVREYPDETYNSLLAIKKSHQEKVQALKEAIAANQCEDVTIEQIGLLRDQLIALKHTGPQFEQMMNTVEWCKQKQIKKQHVERKGLDLSGAAGAAVSFVFSKSYATVARAASAFKKFFGF